MHSSIYEGQVLPLNFAKNYCDKSLEFAHEYIPKFFDNITISQIKPNYDCNFDN